MSIFHLKDHEREHLKNWLLSILPSWTDAEPESLADSIITILTGQGKSFKKLKEKLQRHLAVFMTDESLKFVNLLLKALKKRSYIDWTRAFPDNQQATKAQNQTTKSTGNVESLDTRTENTINTVVSSNWNPNLYSRFDNEKKSENEKGTTKKNFWNNRNCKYRKTNAPSNVCEKFDNSSNYSIMVSKKPNNDPYTCLHLNTFRNYKTNNVNQFASESKTKTHHIDPIVNRDDSGQTIDQHMATDEHFRLCPQIEEKGFCDHGVYCPYATNLPSVSGTSNYQCEMIDLIDQNAFNNFDLHQSSYRKEEEQNSNNFSLEFSNFSKMDSASNNLSNDQRIGELFPSLKEIHPDQTPNQIDAHAFKSSMFFPQQSAEKIEIKNQNFQNEHQTALIIKGIPRFMNHITDLINHFQQFGTIVYCENNFQNEPTSVLVQFSDPSEATKAFRNTAAVFGYRFIQVFRANKLTDIQSLSSSVENPQLNNSYNKKFPYVFDESIMTFNYIPDSPPKPTTNYHISALKQSLEQIDELVAYQERCIKKMEEVPTVPDKNAIMVQLELNMLKIAELKQRIQQLYEE